MIQNFSTAKVENKPIAQVCYLTRGFRGALALAKTLGGTILDKHRVLSWKGRVALSVAGIISLATPAQALKFNMTYAPGTTQQQIEAVELATGIWSSYLKDDITVNFHFEMTNGELDSSVLAGATPAIARNINYLDFKTSAITEATASGQSLFLPDSTNTTFSQLLQDGTINNNNSQIMLTHANAKALGINTGSNTTLDGYIQMSSSVNWDYSYNPQTINNNHYDFVSAVLHEIGHNLGFISGLDTSDLTANNQNQTTALDLLRYSTESAAAGAIDFSIGNNAYFSIDGGQSPFGLDLNGNQIIDPNEQAYFSKGEDTSLGGDGFQTGHWLRSYNNILGIMDPVLAQGKVRAISQLDLALLDYIGWNVDYSSQINLEQLGLAATTKANNAVIVDRSSEVEQMIQDSEIYHVAWSNQRIRYWQKANPSQTPINNTVSVPEPNSSLGLFTLAGIMGIGAALKRR